MSDLQWSIKNGDLDAVKAIVDGENVNVNEELASGRYPIHYAADMGQTDVLKYLISKGANVNQLDKHGISALLAAVWESHIETVKYLLEAGADKTAKTPDGQSMVSAAEKAEVRALLK